MNVFKTINLSGYGKKYQGKVRDYYITKSSAKGETSKRILITTDRVSAFDQVLGFIPNKGQVLNQLSSFWFQITSDIIENHMIAVPDSNVMIVKNCNGIPIEMVVRGYITGVTGTSIWGSYEKGERIIYGIKFPEGLKKNQKLPKPIITPTTKAEHGHDERLTHSEIIKRKLVSRKIYDQMEKAALELFQRGEEICEKRGLILVDTKYEFGMLGDKLLLIDEIHTPDSSRFWLKKNYESSFERGREMDNYDKEYLRLWFKKKGYVGDPSADSTSFGKTQGKSSLQAGSPRSSSGQAGRAGKTPKMPASFVNEVNKRYIKIYELITGSKFLPGIQPIDKRIQKKVRKFS